MLMIDRFITFAGPTGSAVCPTTIKFMILNLNIITCWSGMSCKISWSFSGKKSSKFFRLQPGSEEMKIQLLLRMFFTCRYWARGDLIKLFLMGGGSLSWNEHVQTDVLRFPLDHLVLLFQLKFKAGNGGGKLLFTQVDFLIRVSIRIISLS